ncbi:histone H5-like [Amblyomma americanum]|uniref:H15 domain-containing protein n=1 Tax=Amblyomma americanum TaxID=6943 RepID=A0AAQ4FAB2_AMBAM
MSDAEVKPAVPPTPKAKGRKSTAGAPKKAKKPASHPKYTEMVKKSIEALKERGGSSRQAIHKYIMSHYDVGKDSKVVNTHLKLALKRAVQSGLLKRSKGTGASGSFRLADKAAAGPKKSPVKRGPKKAGVAKPKKVIMKTTLAKSPAKKAAKPKAPKAAKPKTAAAKPKVAKKPKSPKKAKSPKKPKVAKKATPKKAAAKK